MSQYPQRDGEADCRDYLRTGRCKYGESCKYHHPIGGVKAPTDPSEPLFPLRPNEPPCQYYMKHGTCKFGQTCKFHHPAHLLASNTILMNVNGINVLTNSIGHESMGSNSNNGDNISDTGEFQQNGTMMQILPQRPGESECLYFLRNGRCKYGATCKYHHPTSNHKLDVNLQGTHSLQMQFLSRNGRSGSVSTGSVLEGTIQFSSSQENSQGYYSKYQTTRNRNGDIGGPTHILVSDAPISVLTLNEGSRSPDNSFRQRSMNINTENFTQTSHKGVDALDNKKSFQYHRHEQLSSSVSSPNVASMPIASCYEAESLLEDFVPSSSSVQDLSNISSANEAVWKSNASDIKLSSLENEDGNLNSNESYIPATSNNRQYYEPHSNHQDHPSRHLSSDVCLDCNNLSPSRIVSEPFDSNQGLNEAPNRNRTNYKAFDTDKCHSEKVLQSPHVARLNSLHSGEWKEDLSHKSSFDLSDDNASSLVSTSTSGSPSLTEVKEDINLDSPLSTHLDYSNLHNGIQHNQAKNVDDGLSMMTSALLTLLDTPDQVQSLQSTNIDYSEKIGTDQYDISEKNSNSEKKEYNSRENGVAINNFVHSSNYYSSNYTKASSALQRNSLYEVNNSFSKRGVHLLSFGDDIDVHQNSYKAWSPAWKESSKSTHGLERNAQSVGVSAIQASHSSPVSSHMLQ